MKILKIMLLVGVISFLGVCSALAETEYLPGVMLYSTLAEYENLTGEKIEKFNEAPMLKTMVATGEILALEQRLPEEPLVLEPIEKIGKYGGIMTAVATGPATMNDAYYARVDYLLSPNNALTGVMPNILKGWDFSEDNKTLILYLRRGMRWSDGAPFTVDDFLFHYEDFISNEELTPVFPGRWSPGGEPMKMEKIDQYTVRLQFAVPFPVAPNYIGYYYASQDNFFNPKHYLKQWHIKYNPKADELAKQEGYEHWYEAFNFHAEIAPSQQDTNLPTVNPWVLKERTPTQKIFVRNPYYWKIDTAGNQLPYIDELVCEIVMSSDVADLKAVAGELTFTGLRTALKNYPLYKQNEEISNYTTLLYPTFLGSETSLMFNQTCKDEVLRNIFRDVRFKQAMSIAINRDEINETLYFGKAVPRQATVVDCSYQEESWARAYAQYDPATANGLLDEIGLTWDKEHEYRLRPDGKRLEVTMEIYNGRKDWVAICEMVREYWENVGVKVAIKTEDRSFNAERRNANETEVFVWHMGGSELRAYKADADGHLKLGGMGVSVLWDQWYNTKGQGGEEPPEHIKKMYENIDKWLTATTAEEYTRLAKELFSLNSEYLYFIGTVGMSPKPLLISNDLGNFPEKGYFDDGNSRWMSLGPAQWFLKK